MQRIELGLDHLGIHLGAALPSNSQPASSPVTQAGEPYAIPDSPQLAHITLHWPVLY